MTTHDGLLEGKVALITGSARGIGEATARLFVDEGARVVLSDVLDDEGKAVAQDLGERAAYVRLDVTSESDWSGAVDFAASTFGSLDVLVNNAGVLVMKAIEDTTLEDFRYVVDVNQTGAFLGIRACIPTMREAGGGSIVNVSSVDGINGLNGLVAYSSSKFGMRGLSRVAALELGKHGIRVNAVCPGAGNPEMPAPWIPKGIDLASLDLVKHRPLRRLGECIEVAQTILFLASDRSSYCTGSELIVDGGEIAGRTIPGFPGA